MAIPISKFLQSPLRDTLQWTSSNSGNLRRARDNAASYRDAFSGGRELCCCYGPVIAGNRSVIYSDTEMYVLGETIAKVMEPVVGNNFVWCERFVITAGSMPAGQYGLVVVQDGVVLIDQVLGSFDQMLMDYVRLLPPTVDRLVTQFNLSNEEVESLASALATQPQQIQSLARSALSELDIRDQTLAKTRVITQSLADVGIVDPKNMIILIGAVVCLLVAFIVLPDTNIFSEDDGVIRTAQVPGITENLRARQVYKPTDVINGMLPVLYGALSDNYWHVDSIGWNEQSNDLNLSVLVDNRFMKTATVGLRRRGFDITSAAEPVNWEGSESLSVRTSLDSVEQVAGDWTNNENFVSLYPGVEAEIKLVQQQEGVDWVRTIALWLDGKVVVGAVVQKEASVLGPDGQVDYWVDSKDFTLSFQQIDTETLVGIARFLDQRPVQIETLSLTQEPNQLFFDVTMNINLFERSSI